jgi:hypothetical protein
MITKHFKPKSNDFNSLFEDVCKADASKDAHSFFISSGKNSLEKRTSWPASKKRIKKRQIGAKTNEFEAITNRNTAILAKTN